MLPVRRLSQSRFASRPLLGTPANGLSKKGEDKRRTREQLKSKQAARAQIEKKLEEKSKLEARRRYQKQLRIAESTFEKLLLVKSKHPDAREAADQIIRVIQIRRGPLKGNSLAPSVFDGYQYWNPEISAANTYLPKGQTLTRADVQTLFTHWDTIQRLYHQRHPEFFKIGAQTYPAQAPVEPGQYRIKLRSSGSGPTFEIIPLSPKAQVPQRTAPRPQTYPQAKPLVREERILTRKEKKAMRTARRKK